MNVYRSILGLKNIMQGMECFLRAYLEWSWNPVAQNYQILQYLFYLKIVCKNK